MAAARSKHVSDNQRLLAMPEAYQPAFAGRFWRAFVTLTSHRMATERAVSHYNNIRSICRLSMSSSTINERIIIPLTRALEGGGGRFIPPHLFFPDVKNGGAQRRRFWHTCLEFNNTSCVQILTL